MSMYRSLAQPWTCPTFMEQALERIVKCKVTESSLACNEETLFSCCLAS
jgi:hypothetical protein